MQKWTKQEIINYIKEEIERQSENEKEYLAGNNYAASMYWTGKKEAYKNALALLDVLEG